jgi:dolichol-phosphate mannosyltransferase
MRSPRVLLNVPILNEIQNIEHLVTSVMRELDGQDFVLLIVDDGSTDGTLEYLSRVAPTSRGRIVVLPRQKKIRGCQRGAALLAGVKWGLANGPFDVFVEMDGDLSHRLEELRSGIERAAQDDVDVVIASKYVPGSHITGRTVGRTLISIVCNVAVRALIRWRISDFSNGYRFYNLRAAALLPQYFIRYGSPIYLTEVMAIWLSNGLRVAEIPSHYVGRCEGWSKVRFGDYVKASIGVFEIASRYWIRGFTRDALSASRTHPAVASPPPERGVAPESVVEVKRI